MPGTTDLHANNYMQHLRPFRSHLGHGTYQRASRTSRTQEAAASELRAKARASRAPACSEASASTPQRAQHGRMQGCTEGSQGTARARRSPKLFEPNQEKQGDPRTQRTLNASAHESAADRSLSPFAVPRRSTAIPYNLLHLCLVEQLLQCTPCCVAPHRSSLAGSPVARLAYIGASGQSARLTRNDALPRKGL